MLVTPALLIDDDDDLVDSVRRAASAARLDLVTATSWDEGLGLFHVLSPNLVIADYNMPGSRHGLMLLARIRRLRPTVRLVLVSGYLEPEDLEQVLDLDIVDSALTKGTGAETAREIVRQVREAEARADESTEWLAASESFIQAAKVSSDDLERLDALLREKIEGKESK